jgi:hypothetical protein
MVLLVRIDSGDTAKAQRPQDRMEERTRARPCAYPKRLPPPVAGGGGANGCPVRLEPVVPLGRLERPRTAPEAAALSAELQGLTNASVPQAGGRVKRV